MATRKVTHEDVEKAKKDYRRVHGGLRGNGRAVETVAANPLLPLVELGQLVSVVYRTRKGKDHMPTDYHHEFSARGLPLLAFEKGTSLLVIAGGIYHVNERGIID
jgi:hypothetical protein